MWIAFVFFGMPAYAYFIEGDNKQECNDILLSSFGKKGKVEQSVSDIFENEYLTPLLGIFNVTEDVFSKPQKNPIFIKKSKDEMPMTLRSVDGEFCKMCKQFYPMSIANQSDGTMVCWSCRDSNRWMFQ